MFDTFVFGGDVHLRTEHPVAVDSHDDWSPPLADDQPSNYYGKPLSFMCDHHSGEAFARQLLALRPGRTRLLDLGTATGSVPLTMRGAGMLALGVDGLDVGKRGEIEPHMLPHDEARSRFAWRVAPEIVDCCDITRPFRIEDAAGQVVKFDWIVSTDCFEHLVAESLPVLLDNVDAHLAEDGFGIFEINSGTYHHIHQTVRPVAWWRELFASRFVVDDERMRANFTYVRSKVEGGRLMYLDGNVEEFKSLFWVRKR